MNPTIIKTVRTLIEVRDSAFEDLHAGQWRDPNSDYIQDRVKDIAYANRALRRIADAHSMTTDDIVGACRPFGPNPHVFFLLIPLPLQHQPSIMVTEQRISTKKGANPRHDH